MNRPAGAGSANENIRKKIQMQRNDEIKCRWNLKHVLNLKIK